MVKEDVKKPTLNELEEMREIVARAKEGDESAVPRLRELLRLYPALWERAGNLARQAETAWICLAAGPNLHAAETSMRFVQKMRADLTRPTATMIERLIVDRVVTCWLQMQFFVATEANALSADESPRLLAFRAKRQAQAQRMYDSAMSALVAFQKLHPEPRDVTPQEPVALPCTRPSISTDEPTLDPAIHNRIEAYLNGEVEHEFEKLHA